jgi:hypothetical protein
MNIEEAAPQLLYMPQRGIHSHFFLPFREQLPPGEARTLGFNFPGLPSFGTAVLDMGLKEDLVAYGLEAAVTDAEAGTVLAVSLLLYHTHKGVQRQVSLQGTQFNVIAGTAGHPKFLKSALYLAKGDALTVEVSNACTLAGHPVAANFYVALDCINPDEAEARQ